ncbi:UNVERIFIED_CONTAM: protein PLASTID TRANSCRIPTIONALLY ACTIVE 16, chloroplastic [Sesamum radiatum]|uniref:Protein PLASTID TRANSCRIPTIONALLY ACTIVE 16, chloroplastic n=1 Tax=Sesamum radiatum TaxID=300843 RepID=A0AAW2W469_SESRA
MAPTLTSNSFLLTTTPHSRITPKNHRLTVFAKKAGPFSPFGKTADDSSPDEAQSSGNSSPFRFDFSKLPDVKSLVPVVANPSSGLGLGGQRRKDSGTVFVAGATGQAGIRIAQTLLRQGFSVRAGVPDLGAAQELARLAAKYKIISNDESKRLNAVDSSYEDAESIAKAIGNASKVVVTIGPAENGPSAEVTTSDALQVIEAAQLANVGHVAIVYDGSSAISSTYNVLDGISSFFNNLFSRSQPLTIAEFLQKVVETDVSYTLIKTSLTEDFSPESSYNLVVTAEGNAGANDYKVIFLTNYYSLLETVAKSQIASLVADVFTNTAVAENKVVEVFTDPSAPSKAIDELFSAIPEDGRRKAYAEALAKAKAEEEAIKASDQARAAAEATRKLEEEVKKLEEQEARAANLAAEAQEKAEAAGASVESFLEKAKGVSWENLGSQLKSAVQKLDNVPKVQIATVRGQAKARSLPSLKAVVKKPARQPKDIPQPKSKQTDSKKETRKVFGGLFQQETIYIDDD